MTNAFLKEEGLTRNKVDWYLTFFNFLMLLTNFHKNITQQLNRWTIINKRTQKLIISIFYDVEIKEIEGVHLLFL